MKDLFLAKSKSKKGYIETIQEHTNKLLKNFDVLKKCYPNIKNLNWDILRIACIYHDLGKINTKFQNKLGNNLKDDFPKIKEIPHGYLSPSFLPIDYLEENYDEDDIRVLYQSIYYHHNRGEIDDFDDFQTIINEDLSKYVDVFKYDKMLPIDEGLNDSYSEYVDERIGKNRKYNHLVNNFIMTKGLLNKIDYSSSGGFEIEIKNEDLFEKTKYSIERYGYKLNDLQEYMINHQDENNIIVASTGIGKTEASLLWIGNNKGFFTLPLKVSINAIYDRVIDENKINFDNSKVALLHSDTMSELLSREKEGSDNKNILRVNKFKQFSMPLTLCTLDQLVDFIFKYDGFELKLATLGYSKLIIDEIQMYSPELLGYLLVALSYIDKMGGKFSIVTATLPTIVLDFLNELGVKYTLPKAPFIKTDRETNQCQIRHKIKIKNENLNVEDILTDGYENKKILVIANTVKQAQNIYNKLKSKVKEGHNINLLHSRFIKKDRKVKEEKILKMGRLDNNECGIWVTTQVVEASLDIDFDVLYTELSEVCGLFQRMGRVYRNRNLKTENPNIFIYVGNDYNYPSGIRPSERSVVDIDIFKLSKKYLLDFDNKVLNELDKMEIVKEVYDKKNIANTKYYKSIKDAIDFASTISAYDLDKNDIRLRDINNETFIPTIVYKANKEDITSIIDTIKNSTSKKEIELARMKLYDYSVSWSYNKTQKSNTFKEIHINDYEKIRVLDIEYTKELGVTKLIY